MDIALANRVINIIDRDLHEKLWPELQTSSARLQVDYMSRLLRWLAIQIGSAETAESVYRVELSRLLTDHCAHEGDEAHPTEDETSVSYDFDLTDRPIDAPTRALRRLATSRFPGSNQWFLRYIDLETRLVRALDPESGQKFGDIYQGGRLERPSTIRSEQQVTSDRLTEYLRRKMPEHDEASASEVQMLPGGFGKDTILFEIRGGTPFDGQVVMRKDFLVPPGPGSVVTELPLLSHLFDAGVPVPKALWAESDTTFFGGAFIVVERVAGANDMSSWSGDPDRSRHVVERMAEILARVHSIAPAAMGRMDLQHVSSGDALRDHMRSFYQHYRDRAPSIHPRIEAAFSWLFANLPTAEPRTPPVLVHGDFGFHNILTRGAEVTAVLDWEFAHFGDPAEDLSYFRPFVEKVLPWTEFLDLYQRFGGRVTRNESSRCFQIWGDLRNACMGVGAVGTLELSKVPDIRSAAAGLAFGPLCELQALRGIIA